MLRLDEDVQAEHGLDERRVREAQTFDREGRDVETDRHLFAFCSRSCPDQASAATIGPCVGGSSSPPWRRWQAPSPHARVHAQGQRRRRARAPDRDGGPRLHDPTTRTGSASSRCLKAHTPCSSATSRPSTTSADMPAGLKLQVDSGEFVGEKTFEIQLDRGAYGYACSPHWQIMNGTLTVFPAPVTTPRPKPLHTLKAGVAAGGTTYGPKAAKQGRYRIVVRDARSGTTSTSPARGSTAAPGSASPARRPGRSASRAARTATAATPSRSRAGCASASSP